MSNTDPSHNATNSSTRDTAAHKASGVSECGCNTGCTCNTKDHHQVGEMLTAQDNVNISPIERAPVRTRCTSGRGFIGSPYEHA